MKLITRDTDYAVKALRFLAKHKKKTVSVAELVRELKMPRPFLRKLLQILNKKKILISRKGQGGGFLLAGDPQRIFLLDLMEIFQGPLRLNECIFKKKTCPDRNICSLRRKINNIEKYVVRQLQPITIANL